MNQESGLSTGLFDEFDRLGISTPFSWMGNFPNSYDGSYHEGLTETIARAQMDYASEKLAENFQTLMSAVIKAKPQAAKGQYLKSVTLTTTMGPGVKVNPAKISE